MGSLGYLGWFFTFAIAAATGGLIAIVGLMRMAAAVAEMDPGDELQRWRVHAQQYRQWLGEFDHIALVLDNLAAEARGESISVVWPPQPGEGPWSVQGLREILLRQAGSE